MAPFKVVPLCHHAHVAGWEAVSRCVIVDWNQQERAVMYLGKFWHLAAVLESGSAQSAAWSSLCAEAPLIGSVGVNQAL